MEPAVSAATGHFSRRHWPERALAAQELLQARGQGPGGCSRPGGGRLVPNGALQDPALPFPSPGRQGRPRLAPLSTQLTSSVSPASSQAALPHLAPRTSRHQPHAQPRSPDSSHPRSWGWDPQEQLPVTAQSSSLSPSAAPRAGAGGSQLTSFVLCPQASQLVAMIITSLKCGISGAGSQGNATNGRAGSHLPPPPASLLPQALPSEPALRPDRLQPPPHFAVC